MKRKRMILKAIWGILFLFFISFSGYSQISDNWAPIHTEITGNLRDIAAFNADSVFVLTDDGKIISTSDGWQTIRERNPQVGKEIKINALHANSTLNTLVGVGDGGTIFRTANMGESWENLSFSDENDAQLNILGISDDGDNYDESTVYAVGENGLILKSTDDGINWEKIIPNVAANQDFKFVTFLNADTGFVANENGIIRTFDGGKSWKVILTESNTVALRIADLKKLADELVNVSISSEGGGIQTSVDYGQTWKTVEFERPCDLLNTGGILFGSTQCEALYNGSVVESYSGWVGITRWNILSGNEFSGIVIPRFEGMSLEGVPVVMRNKDDQSVVAESVTDSGGRFRFDIPLSMSGSFEIMEHESWERQYCLVPLEGDTLPPWNPDQDCDAFKIELNIINPAPVNLYGLTILDDTWFAVGQGGVVLMSNGPGDADGDGYGDLWSRQISHTNEDLFAAIARGIEKSDIRRGFAVGNAGTIITSQKPELEIISPTGTDSICAGTEITIEWTGGDPTWDLLISLIDVNTSNIIANITSSTPNDGTEIWSVPAGFPPGIYQVYIQEVNFESWVYGQPFTVHHCPETPVCLEMCANNMVQNRNFNQNAVFGPMPGGSVANWSGGGTPDVSKTHCSDSDTVSIGMWGNQVTGENMWQNLATPFVPGKTYSISFSAKWAYANNQPYPVQFEFRTTNAAYANNTLIGISDPLTTPGTWVTVTLPDWTATGSVSDPFSTLIVKATNQSSFFHPDSTSYGYITAICVSEVPVTGLADNPKSSGFKLGKSYPNPFSHATTIHYTIPYEEKVTLKIFSMNGTEITSLVNELKSAGNHQAEWQPDGISGGVYFCRMQAGNFIETRKIVLQNN